MRLTNMGGLFFNCNRVKRRCLFSSIGMRKYDDMMPNENLLRAVAYN